MIESTPKTIEINLKLLLFISFLGFAGGCLAFFFISWCFDNFSKASPSPSDAISIANTYIVYTTIIFTALAIFLAIATYYFSVQQARNRRYLEGELLDVLIKQCKKDTKIGIKLITKLIENPSAVQKFEELQSDKLKEIIESYIEQYYPELSPQKSSSPSINDEVQEIKDKLKKGDSSNSETKDQSQPIKDEKNIKKRVVNIFNKFKKNKT